MTIKAGIFGDDVNFKDRFISDHNKLGELVKYWKTMGLKIVLTSGTFDMVHIGHLQYLEKAKKMGDILIVSVDSDEKTKKRKGEGRPVVPELERLQILAHSRYVDVLTLKNTDDSKFQLLKAVHPDVLVISETTEHFSDEIEAMKEFCGKLEIIEPQSSTSTTARIRLLFVDGAKQLADKLTPEITSVINKVLKEIKEGNK